jgi:predicted SprT family Zn-dependent metalloprotease
MQSQAQQILERCQQVIAKAMVLYGLDMSSVQVRFDLRGRAAGQAYRRGMQYGVRFNRDMLTREAFDHVLNNTVPHEFAHIACFMNPELGRNHDSGWKKVCIALGGTGLTGHREEVVFGKGATYEYITTTGQTVRVGDRYHQKVRAGTTLTFRGGKGSINQFCTYSIVGMKGRTLATPIIRNATSSVQAANAGRSAKEPAAVAAHVVRSHAQDPAKPAQPRTVTGESKATICRRIAMSGYNQGRSYNEIIQAMMAGSGYNRETAEFTFRLIATVLNIPATFYS